MPDILRIKTSDWELFVWASDIKTKQARFNKTLAARNSMVADKVEGSVPQSSIRFQPAIEVDNGCDESYCFLGQSVSELPLLRALFF